ncbi:aminotransferase class I/II-fold pyridoxal phosphate-dependent enzyme [Echinicola jeungdonensis]|uniref:Aminotransferase class I/II-fold pyridoxal phosphate-dependent enzyme n=1 Tax=Echinicola jeungdonensis TaxID=709343 RepID=A0ABV5J788_9BACT|nr:aminotransferase class I/II-fold pyridoxal phosphate-dependent enzyme [Echinicola jeungdonensis]MDN3669155.1 aminotransferase class I/II-fold pyridoxal phosphate-dependent enzyme [Echinicola jeungdonensis]
MKEHPIAHHIDRVIKILGQEFLYFSGTAYLGIGTVREFEDLVLEGIKKYGPNYGASRSGNIRLEVFDQMEHYFAHGAGAEDAALLSSGFLAGQITIRELAKLTHELWAAPDAHPAIIPEGQYFHGDQNMEKFARECIQKSHQKKGNSIGILVNAIDTLFPAVHDFEWTRDLSPANEYFLLVDDSHAFGLLGHEIFGTYQQWKNLPAKLIVSGSLGKALGIPAGVIIGEKSFIQSIKTNPWFIGASPPAPGFCDAFLKSKRIYLKQQRILLEKMDYFFDQIKGIHGIKYVNNFPVVRLGKNGWADKLWERGLIISSFSYPSPSDPPMERAVLSAFHQKSDLEFLAKTIQKLS